MNLASFWLTISITFGPGGADLQGVDVGGSVLIQVPVSQVSQLLPGPAAGALTVGPLIFVDPWMLEYAHGVVDHELVHVRQWEALGPALPLAYALNLGQEFESYWSDSLMWAPDDDMSRCPIFRWQSGDGSQFMPCWRF